VNHGGVMPIIFAQSLMLFPRRGVQKAEGPGDRRRSARAGDGKIVRQYVSWLNDEFGRGNFIYVISKRR
jgi:preprotein translocase subunit SecY